jgi:cytoskeletal protein RodZ
MRRARASRRIKNFHIHHSKENIMVTTTTSKTGSKKTTVAKRTTAAKTTAEKKAPAVKKTASKTTAAKAPAAKTAVPKTTVKKTATRKPAAKKKTVTPEERYRMIATAAYYLAEKRKFARGHEIEDWCAAEREIDARIGEL